MQKLYLVRKIFEMAEETLSTQECVRCGKVMESTDGRHDCKRCAGLNNTQLIDLRMQLISQNEEREKIGKITLLISIIVSAFIMYFSFHN